MGEGAKTTKTVWLKTPTMMHLCYVEHFYFQSLKHATFYPSFMSMQRGNVDQI